MNSILKTSILALACVALSELFAASPSGKAQLGEIKNNQYIVTQEVDSVFTSWTNGNSVAFKANTTNFWIGGYKLSDLLGVGQETDPMFNNF